MQDATLATRCCIAGGGPAGIMLGLLLARAGVEVVVLEKHADFLRDFRGDTVHPSTLQVMHELGLLDAFLARPHDRVPQLTAVVGGESLTIADFTRVRTRCRFIALMPQWEFLDFLRDEAERYPGFRLVTQAEVTGVIEEDGRVAGVEVATPDGPLRVQADLVVGADGRRSTVRASAGLVVRDLGAPIDVLWMRMPRRADDTAATAGRIDTGRFLVTINRGSYWQCAYVIPKGGIEAVHARGIEAFRAAVAGLAPMLSDRIDTIATWDDVKLLSVTVDRLEEWSRPGVLCIGDAAHAMSPIGGVGINLAIQDAVATANELATPLAAGLSPMAIDALLAKVQRRREWPTRVIQAGQVLVQNRLLKPAVVQSDSYAQRMRVPMPLRLLTRFPRLTAIPAWLIGVGVRPEHVRSPLARPGKSGQALRS